MCSDAHLAARKIDVEKMIHHALKFVKGAARDESCLIGCVEEMDGLITVFEGITSVLGTVLDREQPGITSREAQSIAREYVASHFVKILDDLVPEMNADLSRARAARFN